MAYLLEKTFEALRQLKDRPKQARAYAKWKENGRPNPPPHLVKQQVLREFAGRFGLEILVETGTFRGDMVQAMKSCFKMVYSIELSDELFEAARRRFHRQANVEIIHGDSGRELSRLIPRLDRPTLFWLDGHYSAGNTARGEKDTPVYEELDAIFNSHLENYAIIIDDARLFGVDPSYPTLSELRDRIENRLPNCEIQVESDSIRITLRQA